MRVVIVCVAVAAVVAFLLGRASNPPLAAGASATHVYTGRLYDVFRVPGAATRCEVRKGAGSLALSCSHVPFARARHEVVFSKDNIVAFRLGSPEKPVWSAHGRP